MRQRKTNSNLGKVAKYGKVVKRYSQVDGAHLKDNRVQVYGERLEELKDKHGGELTPNLVVSDAKRNNSPLHDYFEWNNTLAGEKYRLSQANYLIRSINVEVINQGEVQAVKAFFSIKRMEDKKMKSVYVSSGDVFSNQDIRNQVISYALDELQGWKERYKQYSELHGAVKFITGFVAQRKRR